ncbi:pimeloyl-ACP methyl ester carboxylesterase [Actinomadura luteofluorescens]|uniref:Pimeloyl-ACP methyl ester carboxylesterase n=2 Tax=Actinomadura luteofluorescens TaxID=46163 RepID=A0A7Y9EHK9_9ACTN|nr:pimeloyl-ACP methyl ester carboxylesterase [Actinomadura luteofluorescens]
MEVIMADVQATVWGDGPASAVFVHGIFSWGADELYGFGNQRPLEDEFRLVMMDRRGHGASPDIEGSDYETDADDITVLLGDGAHLVAHSYGGAGAMLAAVRRPDLVRSLTLIQPGTLRPAAGHPVVDEALERARAGTAGLPPEMTPEEYLRASTEGIGMPVPEATPERLRAVRAAMRERPCWDAEIPLDQLAAAPWPKLMISGTWEDAPELYRRYAGEPLIAAAEFIAERIGARYLKVPGYYPQVQQPSTVNDALRDLWRCGPE